ncbi:MAG: hypothetical protein GF418_13705 [Chitinivibrionales bacterium]|nr:hypothetical protein [Chitinivibrionales bacterium]MBD3396676.1 hypothetical protein [Chitinivibrionales bacterium]
MRTLLVFPFLVLLALFAGCDRGKVLITGRLTDYKPRDSVLVSLTRNWEQIRLEPQAFTVKRSGEFELEFTVGRNPPPVTFVKNGKLYARLVFHSLWQPSPVLIDEVRNQVFELSIKENGLFTARVDL